VGWERVGTIAELEQGPLVVRRAPRQVAVFRHSGRNFALDNRCPHEGYPLAQGTVDAQGVLTCHWHNWRFRLSDGRCVLGGDDVASYPTREAEGCVWVDLSGPAREEAERKALEGLRKAFDERDYGRIGRELARLGAAGADPRTGVEAAIVWSHDRLQYGTTHAFAGAADWLAERERWSGRAEEQLACLAEAVDHMALDALRHPQFPFAAPAASWDAEGFAEAVEGQRSAEAEALIGAALDGGMRLDELEGSLGAAALAHYNDFGHALIYVHKSIELAERVGRDAERALALALARQLCFTTREDKLPEFRGYAEALGALSPPDLRGGSATTGRPEPPFGRSTSAAFVWLAGALAEAPVEAVFDALVEALARNLLHFDLAFDRATDSRVQDNVGWLDFTHGLTFAEAVHVLATRHPELWRPGLLQMACFVGRNRPYLDRELDERRFEVEDEERFLEDLSRLRVDHGLRDPIFAVHVLKTSLAVERLLARASSGCRRVLLAALNRFAHAPIKQKHPLRFAHQALDLVGRDGQPRS
jgi:nitrite reductase/ring-hydroxylating ferredoxin subunit